MPRRWRNRSTSWPTPQFVRHFRSEDWTQWDEGAVPVKVDLVRPKTDYQFFTFVDRDAVVALKEWLNVRRSLHGSIRSIEMKKRSVV